MVKEDREQGSGALAEDVEDEDGVVRSQRAAGLAYDDRRRLDAPLNAHVLQTSTLSVPRSFVSIGARPTRRLE